MQISKITFNNGYNRYSQNNYQKEKFNYQQFTNQNSLSKDEINFEGFSFRKLLPKTKKENLYINTFMEDIKNLLCIDPNDIKKYVTPESKNRMEFFRGLATKARDEFFLKHAEFPSARLDLIDTTYNAIKNPNSTQLGIVKRNEYSLDDTINLLNVVSQKSENETLYKKLTELKNPNDMIITLPAETIMKILNSENSAKLNENFEAFSSYIQLNYKKDGFVEDLLSKLSSSENNIHTNDLDKILEIQKKKKDSHFLNLISDKDLIEIDNDLGLKLFNNKRMVEAYLSNGSHELNESELKFYKNVISSTNETNFKARKLFFDNQCITSINDNDNSIEDIERLFKRIDDDKYFRKIYENIGGMGYGLSKEPIDKLLYYVDSFGSETVYKKLNRFVLIANENIHPQTEPEKIVKVISENLNNKYYQTAKMKEDVIQNETLARYNMFFPKTKVALLKLKQKIKYGIMPKLFGTGEPTPINKNVTYRKQPLREEVNMPTVSKTLPALVTEPKPIKVELPVRETSLEEVIESPKVVTSKPTIRRDYKAKKLEIQKDAQEIIESRMKSKKQIGEQLGRYLKNATKIRNQFLNEMFNSVKETRVQQRAQGIKRPTVSNADVLEVYQKINGKNKKLFKYLLNNRKENGEREFNLKQISKILDDVMNKRPQKINPSEK